MNLYDSFLIISYFFTPTETPTYFHFTPLSAIVMERGHYALGSAMPLESHRIKILEYSNFYSLTDSVIASTTEKTCGLMHG